MAIELGELILSLKAETSELYEGLEKAKADVASYGMQIEEMLGINPEKFKLPTIKPQVDDSAITNLNIHIDEKIDHIKVANEFMKANPITPKVDMSELDKISEKIAEIKSFATDPALMSGLKDIKALTSGSLKDLSDVAIALNGIGNISIDVSPEAIAFLKDLKLASGSRGGAKGLFIDPQKPIIDESFQRETTESVEVLAKALGGVFSEELKNSIDSAQQGNIFGAALQFISANISNLALGVTSGLGFNFGKQIADAISEELNFDVAKIVRQVRDQFLEMIPKEELQQQILIIKEQVRELAKEYDGLKGRRATTPEPPKPRQAEPTAEQRPNPPPTQATPGQQTTSSIDIPDIKPRPISDDIAQIKANAQKVREAVARSELLINTSQEKGQFLSDASQKALTSIIQDIDELLKSEFGSKSGEQLIDLKGQVAKLQKRADDVGSRVTAETTIQSAKAIGSTFSEERTKARSPQLSENERIKALQQIIDAEQQGREALDKLLASAGDEAGAGLKRAIGTARGQITKATKSAMSDLEGFDIGQDLVAGQNAGIEAAIADAEEVAQRVARATTEAAKEENEIQSPSRKWMEIGRNLIMGQTQGMAQAASQAYAKAQEVAEMTTDKAASVQISTKPFESPVGQKVFGLGLQTFAQGALPEKGELRSVLSDIAKSLGDEFVKNPIKEISDGFARQEAFLKAYASAQGREAVAIPEVLADTVLGNKQGRSLLKELVVNSAGLAGSVAAGPAGAIASIGADIGGALVTRKAVSDLEAFTTAMSDIDEESNGAVKGLALLSQALERSRKAMTKGAETAKEFSDDLFADFAGGVVGNLSAAGLSAAGSNVPFQGAAVAMSSVGAIADAKNAIQEGESLGVASAEAAKKIVNNWIKVFKLPMKAFEAEGGAVTQINTQIKRQRDTSIQALGLDPSFANQLQNIDLSSSGENIVQSLAMGLSDNKEVTDASVALANNIIDVFKKQLQIASPSKVFMQIGQFIVDGLEQGLDAIRNIDIAAPINAMVGSAQQVATLPIGDQIKDSVEQFKEMFSVTNLVSQGMDMLRGVGLNLLGFFAGFKILEVATTNLIEFGQASIDMAIAIQRLEGTLKFVVGSASNAADQIARISEESDRLGTDAFESIQGFTQLAASTRGTSLEGIATEQISAAVQQAGAVSRLTQQQLEQANRAITQISAKGKVSSEELRQQLSEVGGIFSGSFQIAARAVGVTTSELDRMLRRGELLSEDFLPKFAQQLAAETASGVAGAARSAGASLNRFNNAVGDLQNSLGQQILPARQLGLELAADAMERFVAITPALIQALGAIAIKLGVDLVGAALSANGALQAIQARLLAVNSAGATQGLIVGLQSAAKAALGFGKALATAVAPYAAIFGAIETVKILQNSFSDLAGEVSGFAEEATKGFAEYEMAVARATGANNKFLESLPTSRSGVSGDNLFTGTLVESVIGSNLSQQLEGVLNQVVAATGVGVATRAFGGQGIRSFAERQAQAQAIARDELFQQVDQSLSATFGPEVQAAIGEVTNIDAILSSLQSQRRNAANASQREAIGQEINELLARRDEQFRVIGTLQGNLATEKELLEESIKNLNELSVTGGIDRETYERQIAIASEQLEVLADRQDYLTNSVKATVDAAARLAREFEMINAIEADSQLALQLENANRELQLAVDSSGMGQQATERLRGESNIETIRAELRANSEQMYQIIEALQDASIDEAFEALANKGISRDMGFNELLNALENEGDTTEVRNLRQFAEQSIQLSELQSETIRLDTQLVTAQDDLRQQARELAIQYRDLSQEISDFYRDALRSAEDIANEIMGQDLQNATQEISNEIQRELLGLEDSFVSGLGDTFTGLIESLRQPLMDQLDAINQRNSVTRQFEDQMRAAERMQRQANEFDFNAGFGPDLNTNLPGAMALGQPGQPGMPQPTAIANNDIRAAADLAQRAQEEQLAAIDRNLATQADTSSLQAEQAIADIARQLEEGQRTISEQSEGFTRSLRDVGASIGETNPLREFESGLLSLSDQFQDTNRDLEEFKRGLLDTISETSTVRNQLLANVAAGAIGAEALAILPELDATILTAERTLATTESQVQQNRNLFEAQRRELISNFQEEELDRRRNAQQRILEGGSELTLARINQRRNPFRSDFQQQQELGRFVAEIQQESIALGFQFDADLSELDDLRETGELTNFEYTQLRENLIDINEIRLDGLRNQFEELRPTVESITSALSSATGEFDQAAFDRIQENLRLASTTGALTDEQATEARQGLARARNIITTRGDELTIRSLLNEDNAFTSGFVGALGRGDLTAIANLGIQNQQADAANLSLRGLETNPEALANELTRPQFAQANIDAAGTFAQSSDRMVTALNRLTDALLTTNDTRQGGVTIKQQNVTVSRDENEERTVQRVLREFNRELERQIK